MLQCEFLDTCRLRAELVIVSPELAKDYGDVYCWADYTNCAIHMVASVHGPDKVPLDLLPPETARAGEVMEEIQEWSED